MVMDFDVLRMLGTDASGNITGKINPVVNITQMLATGPRALSIPMDLAKSTTCGDL